MFTPLAMSSSRSLTGSWKRTPRMPAAFEPTMFIIELDIQLTSDGEMVVFHDENLRRVTHIDRNVRGCTLAEIKNIAIPANDGKYCSIPTLEEVLVMMKPYCESRGILINIELKTSVIRYDGIESKAYEIVRKYGMEQYIVWSSFLAESVDIIKKIDRDAKTAVLAMSIEECRSEEHTSELQSH